MSETGRFFASSEERDRTTRARTLRSCVTCRNRKVRCDKARPCGACRRSGSECVFLTEARRPLQPRLPNAVLLERIERLESVIEMISSKGSSEASSTPAPERIGSHDSTTEMDRHSTGNNNLPDNYGRLVSSVDGSRYMGPNYWALLKPEVSTLSSLAELLSRSLLTSPVGQRKRGFGRSHRTCRGYGELRALFLFLCKIHATKS